MRRRCTVPTAKWLRSQLSPLYSVTLAAVATEQALAVSPPADRGLVRVSELEDPHHLAHDGIALPVDLPTHHPLAVAHRSLLSRLDVAKVSSGAVQLKAEGQV